MDMAKYSDVRAHMQPGDILAFGGKGRFSEIIKWAIRGPVSHVGIVLQTQIVGGEHDDTRHFNQVIESTSLNGKNGVTINRVSDRINHYDGELWWLPLSKEIRQRLDGRSFFDFLFKQDGKPYDMPQAIKSGIDIELFGKDWASADEDFAKFFCSELCAAGLEAGNAIDDINASEVTPKDLVQFALYSGHYYQLKGECKRIPGYNTRHYEGFGID